jgi:hypothetical protein
LFAALARQFLRLAEIGGIRRIGDDDVRERVRVDPAQALAFVDDHCGEDHGVGLSDRPHTAVDVDGR